ncbi:Fur family transcriptional regulator [Parenemella sanctibonifatiensis]|uniref:Transcriptional repressor n=1 Tax=Parenemella sanctibonifatiensis TaxID=2016505 RepID=A0A255E0R3_9ACTN|nr:Fur family transcriptional regulator [Parenemella sanctibonifatiensis]OYN84591.1 transcriptional repressor [Parenemella sanctibonifatiensis]OYN92637.1 transcriptional repressor [Parenemella sanctibonifatiensis]
MTATEPATLLKQAGLRVTAARLATMAVVTEQAHADAEAIASQVRDRLGSVSRQAVYDVLNALTETGLLRRVNVDSRRTRYELQTHDNHHHLVCHNCGRIEDVPCNGADVPCMTPADDHGFALEVAEVTYRGLCRDCRGS